jgi:hypothetical protein
MKPLEPLVFGRGLTLIDNNHIYNIIGPLPLIFGPGLTGNYGDPHAHIYSHAKTILTRYLDLMGLNVYSNKPYNIKNFIDKNNKNIEIFYSDAITFKIGNYSSYSDLIKIHIGVDSEITDTLYIIDNKNINENSEEKLISYRCSGLIEYLNLKTSNNSNIISPSIEENFNINCIVEKIKNNRYSELDNLISSYLST